MTGFDIALCTFPVALDQLGVEDQPVLLHQWLLNTNPLWSLESKWEWGVPQGNGGTNMGYPDPVSGATGESTMLRAMASAFTASA